MKKIEKFEIQLQLLVIIFIGIGVLGSALNVVISMMSALTIPGLIVIVCIILWWGLRYG